MCRCRSLLAAFRTRGRVKPPAGQTSKRQARELTQEGLNRVSLGGTDGSSVPPKIYNKADYFIGGYRSNAGNSCACFIQGIRSAVWMCTRAGTAVGSSYVALWISMMPGNTLSFL